MTGNENFEVEIPAELRAKYLERRKNDLELLKNSLSSRTFEEFKRIGHQLKGNAASFGYKDLERIAVDLEIAGQQKDSLLAGTQITRFENWLAEASSL